MLALPLFVGGMAVFGFLAALVVVSVVMLWLQPAKDWFDGVTPGGPGGSGRVPQARLPRRSVGPSGAAAAGRPRAGRAR